MAPALRMTRSIKEKLQIFFFGFFELFFFLVTLCPFNAPIAFGLFSARYYFYLVFDFLFLLALLSYMEKIWRLLGGVLVVYFRFVPFRFIL